MKKCWGKILTTRTFHTEGDFHVTKLGKWIPACSILRRMFRALEVGGNHVGWLESSNSWSKPEIDLDANKKNKFSKRNSKTTYTIPFLETFPRASAIGRRKAFCHGFFPSILPKSIILVVTKDPVPSTKWWNSDASRQGTTTFKKWDILVNGWKKFIFITFR